VKIPTLKRVEEGRPVGDMNSNIVLIGFLIMLVCQDIVALKAFKKSAKEGNLCLMIPGYLLIYGSREENRPVKPMIGWLAGATILLIGLGILR